MSSFLTSRLGSWRIALRLARREALHSKLRSTLVVTLIALPVTAAAAADFAAREGLASLEPASKASRQLGTDAAARLEWFGEAVKQNVYGTDVSVNGAGPQRSFEEGLAALPQLLPSSARVLSGGTNQAVILETPNAGMVEQAVFADFTQAAVSGSYYLRSGRHPMTPNEIALSSNAARSLGIGIGDSVTLTIRGAGRNDASLTIVGILNFSQQSIVLTTPERESQIHESYSPGVDSEDYLSTGQHVFIDSSTALAWSDVIKLNSVGWKVTSRAVLKSPPTFCNDRDICGPASPLVPRSEENVIYNAEVVSAVSLISLLAIMQIALLVAPAFAVQLRRRERELGLLAANGADAPVLRRTMLASGVILGLTGSLAGIAFAAIIIAILGGSTPWNYLAQALGTTVGWPEFTLDLLFIIAVGVISAVAGAWATAQAASKTDVIHALRGRRAPGPIRFRIPLLGLTFVAIGCALLLYAGTQQFNEYLLAFGLLSGELGIILMIPWLITRISGISRFLPVSARMSMRDAARQRLRTAAAIAAITAVTTANVAVGMWDVNSNSYFNYQSAIFHKDDLVFTTFTETAEDTSLAAIDQKVVAAIRDTYPDAQYATLRSLLADFPGEAYNWMTCVLPDSSGEALGFNSLCTSREDLWSADGSVMAIDNPENIGLVLGPTADNELAEQALKAGKAIVLHPGLINRDGEVAMGTANDYANDGSQVYMRLPAVEITTGAAPAMIIVGPAALTPDSQLTALTKPETPEVVHWIAHQLHVSPGEPTTASTVPIHQRLNLILAKYGLPASLHSANAPSTRLEVLGLAFFGVITLTLLASLMVTSLTLIDARSDFATLAAVGAAPTARRRFAAATAGFLTLFGGVLGCIAGVVVSFLLSNPILGFSFTLWRFPLISIVVSLTVVPLVTAAIAWATTSPKIEITRRLG